ncbi:MAG: DUF2190 family protein [Candidatus Peribacteraceae bacterium]|nr:DUF2190 family protein [Candidatus Peribacteraceae bacterium]
MSNSTMEAIFRRAGKQIHHTPGSDVSAGAVVVVGSMPAVAERDITSGDLGSLTVEGIFEVLKDTSTFTAGDAVYWDEDGTPVGGSTTGAATTNAALGNLMGFAESAAATGVTTVFVKMTSAERTATIAGSVTADDITGSDSSLGINGLAAAQGGAIVTTGGTSATAGNAGGAVTSVGGTPGVTGVGGAVGMTGGAGGATSGAGGAAAVVGGAGTNGNGAGGAASLDGGAGNGSGADGAITIGTNNGASLTLGLTPRVPVNSNVAVGGTAIGNANAVSEGLTIVTGADDTAAIILPAGAAGMEVEVISSTASKALVVFPQVNSAIDALGANNALTSGGDAPHLRFRATSATQWYSMSEFAG